MLKSAILLLNTLALLMYQLFFADNVTVTQKVPASANPDSEFTVEVTIKKGSTAGFAKLQQELPEGFTAVEDKSNGASFTFSNQSVKFIWMSLPNDSEFKVTYKVKVAEGISGDQSIGGKFSYVTDNTKQQVDIDAATISINGDGGNAVATTKSTTTTTPDENTDNTTTENNTTENTITENNNTATENNTTTASNNTNTNNGDGSFSCIRNVPDNASSDFVVEITVNKGNLGGFAKLLETLPSGFTATAVESAGGSFSFADQKVRYIWVSLPAQPEFKISYKVKVAKGASGAQTIDGTFSYIENDETRKYTMPTSTVNIGGGGAVASNNTTKNNTNTNTSSNNDNSFSATNISAPQAGVVYNVQILALQNRKSTAAVARIYGMSATAINPRMEEGFTKYLVGSYTEYKTARDNRESVKSRGVVSPFVVAYNKGRRITVQEALMATSQKWYR